MSIKSQDLTDPIKWLRVISNLAAIAVGMLALVPGDIRPHTALPGYYEHFLAYFGVCILFGMRARNRRELLIICGLFATYAGALELAQALVPGRHVRLLDFVSSLCGEAFGLVLGIALRSIFLRVTC